VDTETVVEKSHCLLVTLSQTESRYLMHEARARQVLSVSLDQRHADLSQSRIVYSRFEPHDEIPFVKS